MHSLSLLTCMVLTIVFSTRALPISLDHHAHATGVLVTPSEDVFPHAWYKPEEPASSTGKSEVYSTIRSSRSYDPQGTGPDWRRKRTTPQPSAPDWRRRTQAGATVLLSGGDQFHEARRC